MRPRCPATSPRWVRATPYAIGAKFAYPDRPVIAFVGDGAYQMNGMNELHHRQAVLGAVVEPHAHLLRVQQPGPQPGHLGAARPDRRPEVPRLPVDPGLALRAVRRAGRLPRHLLRRRRGHRAGVGRGAGCRPPCVLEVKVDTGGPADAAARQARAWPRSRSRRWPRATPRRSASWRSPCGQKLVEFKESPRSEPRRTRSDARIRRHHSRLDVSAYRVPTDQPGIRRHAGVGLDDHRRRRGRRRADATGLGYTYGDRVRRR